MAKVLIGCKLPNGLIMEIVKPGHLNQPAPPSDQRVVLNGANSVMSASFNPSIGQYGETSVDESLATQWFAANVEHPAVKSGAIFMVADKQHFTGESKDRTQSVRTGFEPLDPVADARTPEKVEADADHLKRLVGNTRR